MRSSRRLPLPILIAGWTLCLSLPAWGDSAPTVLVVTPTEVALSGSMARQQLLVTGTIDGRQVDLTRQVVYTSEEPDIAQVDSAGLVTVLGNGSATIVARIGDVRAETRVRAEDVRDVPRVTFEHDVQPILSRAGCNAGACHGKARGQNGFALSIFGFDPNFDHEAITREARGRRVFPAAPERSLVLLKASAAIPHGGGPRLKPEGDAFEVLRLWIAQGMPRDPADAPALENILVEPTERILKPGEPQQMVVTARYADGTTRDVTHLAAFQSSEDVVVDVDEDGLILRRRTAGRGRHHRPVPGQLRHLQRDHPAGRHGLGRPVRVAAAIQLH